MRQVGIDFQTDIAIFSLVFYKQAGIHQQRSATSRWLRVSFQHQGTNFLIVIMTAAIAFSKIEGFDVIPRSQSFSISALDHH